MPAPSKLTDLPVELPLRTYERAIEAAADQLVSHPDVLSIQQIGSISTPGISDIDLVVVTRDQLTLPIDESYSFRNLAPEFDSTFVHESFFVPESGVGDFYSLFHVMNSVPVRGQAPKIQATSPEPISRTVFLIELASVFYPLCFLRLRDEAPFKVRQSLLLTWSFRYPLRILSELGVDLPTGSDEYISRVERLRTEWFEKDPEQAVEELVGLVDVAIKLSAALLEKLDEQISRSLWRTKFSGNDCRETGRCTLWPAIYVENYSADRALAAMKSAHKATGKWVGLLPASFVVPLTMYRDGGLEMKRILEKNVWPQLVQYDFRNSEAETIIRDRGQMHDRRIAYFRQYIELQMTWNPLPTGFGFQAPGSIRSRLGHGLRMHRLHRSFKNAGVTLMRNSSLVEQ